MAIALFVKFENADTDSIILGDDATLESFESAIEAGLFYNGPWGEYHIARTADMSKEEVAEYREIAQLAFDESWSRDDEEESEDED